MRVMSAEWLASGTNPVKTVCLKEEGGWAEGEENDCADDEDETEHEGTGKEKKKNEMMIGVKILLSCDSRGLVLHRCLPAPANLRKIASPGSSIFYSQLIT